MYAKFFLLLCSLSILGNANSYQWEINISEESLYNLSFYYTNKENVSAGLVEVDGNIIENINFEKTLNNEWKMTYRFSKLLTLGKHSIKISALNGGNIIINRMLVEVAKPIQLVIDTDMMTDSDDAGALAVAHALEDNGEAKILGVMLSAHDERHYNSNTVKAINNYYNGRDNNIKIGIHAPILSLTSTSISNEIKKDFRIDSDRIGNMHQSVWNLTGWGDHIYNYERENNKDIVSQYYKILSQTNLEDHSLVIAVLGTNFNIAAVMKDSRTKELFSKKVKEVVLSAWIDTCNMNTCAVPIPSYRSDSYEEAKKATDYVINKMPKHIKLTTGDISVNVKKHPIKVGQGYINKHIYSPMRVLYEHDCANFNCSKSMLDKGNSIIDALAVLVAVRGISYKGTKYFDMHFKGNGFLESSFSSSSLASWKITGYKNHRVLKYVEESTQYDTMLKNTINNLMMQDSLPAHQYPQDIDAKIYYMGLNPVDKFEAKIVEGNTVQLSWLDTSNSESGFKVYENGILLTILNANATSYTIKGLEAGEKYTYTIKTYKDDSEISSTVLDVSIPALDTSSDFGWLIPVYHIILN